MTELRGKKNKEKWNAAAIKPEMSHLRSIIM